VAWSDVEEDGASEDGAEEVLGGGVSIGGRTGKALHSKATTCMPSCAYVTDPSLSALATAPNSESGPIVPPGAPRAFAAS